MNEEIKKNKFLKDNLEKRNKINDKELLYNSILEKDKEIKILKTKLGRFPFELNEGEKIMSVIFTSSEQTFYQSIICKNTEKFNNVENRLYNIYQNYSESENYFIVRGRIINKSKSLEQNDINNSDIIILIILNEIADE